MSRSAVCGLVNEGGVMLIVGARGALRRARPRRGSPGCRVVRGSLLPGGVVLVARCGRWPIVASRRVLGRGCLDSLPTLTGDRVAPSLDDRLPRAGRTLSHSRRWVEAAEGLTGRPNFDIIPARSSGAGGDRTRDLGVMSRRRAVQLVLNSAIYLVFVRSPVQAVMPCDAPYRQVCWMECWIETTYRAERIAFSYRRTNHADTGQFR